MKRVSLIVLVLVLVPYLGKAQSKKMNQALAAANGEYWQSSSDEGLVKCGRGFFINKMIIKLNYDAPDDLMEVDTAVDSKADASANTATSVKSVIANDQNNAIDKSKLITEGK